MPLYQDGHGLYRDTGILGIGHWNLWLGITSPHGSICFVDCCWSLVQEPGPGDVQLAYPGGWEGTLNYTQLTFCRPLTSLAGFQRHPFNRRYSPGGRGFYLGSKPSQHSQPRRTQDGHQVNKFHHRYNRLCLIWRGFAVANQYPLVYQCIWETQVQIWCLT